LYPKTVTAAYCLLTNCKQEQLAPTVSANDDGVAFANINEDGQAGESETPLANARQQLQGMPLGGGHYWHVRFNE
jgi:hypothetical protein